MKPALQGNSSLNFESKNPVLLTLTHRFIELLVCNIHKRVKRNGIRDALTTTQERWKLLGFYRRKDPLVGWILEKTAGKH